MLVLDSSHLCLSIGFSESDWKKLQRTKKNQNKTKKPPKPKKNPEKSKREKNYIYNFFRCDSRKNIERKDGFALIDNFCSFQCYCVQALKRYISTFGWQPQDTLSHSSHSPRCSSICLPTYLWCQTVIDTGRRECKKVSYLVHRICLKYIIKNQNQILGPGTVLNSTIGLVCDIGCIT